MAHILVSPLSWGIGHAGRMLPVIREFLKRGHRVTVVTSGRALQFLRTEAPACTFLELEDYPAPFTSTPFFVAKFTAYIPSFLSAIAREEQGIRKILSARRYDMIISDARFAVSSESIPSFFVNHQLRFHVPFGMKPVEYLSELFHTRYHRRFLKVIVPDNPPGPGHISGKLSCSSQRATLRRLYYAGILSTVHPLNVPEDLDFLIILSSPLGPGNFLERKVLAGIGRLPGRKVVLLGRPGENLEYRLDNETVVKSHACREEINVLMNRAKFIICRCGYTTLLEIAELNKRRALLIPLRGQTEQEYIARHVREKGWFLTRSEGRLDLVRDVARAEAFAGLPPMPGSAENIRRLFQEVFLPWL